MHHVGSAYVHNIDLIHADEFLEVLECVGDIEFLRGDPFLVYIAYGDDFDVIMCLPAWYGQVMVIPSIPTIPTLILRFDMNLLPLR